MRSYLLFDRTLLDLVQLHVEPRPQLLELKIFSRAFPATRVRVHFRESEYASESQSTLQSWRESRWGSLGGSPVQMMSELYALAAIGERHDALAFRLGHGEHVLQDGGGALPKSAAPAEEKGKGFRV